MTLPEARQEKPLPHPEERYRTSSKFCPISPSQQGSPAQQHPIDYRLVEHIYRQGLPAQGTQGRTPERVRIQPLHRPGQQAAETRVLQQADGSGRADLSGLVPGWSGSQGVQVQGGTLEADGSTVVWDGKSSPVTVTYAYRTGYRDVTLDATLNLFFDSGSRPVFTQPAGAQTVTVAAGQTGTLRAAATDALVYQWYVNRNDGAGYVAVPGATGATYTTGATAVENDGYTYYCEATNAFGTTSSPVFTLRVTAEPEPVPETGDGSDPALWLTLALLSLCGLGALTFGRRRGAARR